jgi:hypothetical protein
MLSRDGDLGSTGTVQWSGEKVLSLVKPMTKVTPEMAAGEFPKGTASDCPETGLAEWTVCTRCPYLCIQVHLHARVLIAPKVSNITGFIV